jgi:regulatory protein
MAGRITAVRIQQRNPKRANVFIEGQFAFGLAAIEAAKLSKGQYLSDKDIAALQGLDEEERAYEQALGFLSYRPRSKAETLRRLGQKGFSEPACEAAVYRLSRAGLLDDEAFARYWIRNREQFKPRGQYALRYELGQKGVASNIIDALVQEVDETENAYRAAMQRFGRWKHLEPHTLRRKLSDYLRRRGFGYDAIQWVWERIVAEQIGDGLDAGEGEDTIWK